MKVYQTLTKTLLILLLTACASLAPRDSEYNWYKSDRPELPYKVVVVDEWNEDVRNSSCGKHLLLHACAIMYWETDTQVYTECIIYTKYKKLPEFILQHEIKHCKGWDHKEP